MGLFFIMSKVKDYFGEKFLSESENIKLDFIHAEMENNYEKGAMTLNWQLTINVGQNDESGHVDALIVNFSHAQYPTLLVEDDKEQTPEFSIIQLPNGWDKQTVVDLVAKYRKEIELAIDEFELEDI